MDNADEKYIKKCIQQKSNRKGMDSLTEDGKACRINASQRDLQDRKKLREEGTPENLTVVSAEGATLIKGSVESLRQKDGAG